MTGYLNFPGIFSPLKLLISFQSLFVYYDPQVLGLMRIGLLVFPCYKSQELHLKNIDFESEQQKFTFKM